MIPRSPVLAGSSMGDNAEKAIVEYTGIFLGLEPFECPAAKIRQPLFPARRV
jgi:hypothetical protein